MRQSSYNIQLTVDDQENNGRDSPQVETMLSNGTDDDLASDRTSEFIILSNGSDVKVESGTIKFSQR
jgi:hypothetical protein